MLAEIDWVRLKPTSDHWHYTRCLYAYVNRTECKVVYIGKADGPSVLQRMRCSSKDALFDYLCEDCGMDLGDLRVLAGHVSLERGGRLTRELLCDVESLLITRMKPGGNVQSVRSRIFRPGLVVTCWGQWPDRRTRFVDR